METRQKPRTDATGPGVAGPVTLVKADGPAAVPATPAVPARPAGPPWIVVPARIIALVVVLPVRLCYELLLGLFRSPRWLAKPLGRAARAFYKYVLAPIGRGFAWVGRGVWSGVRVVGSGLGWLWRNGVARPLHWLFVSVIWAALRVFGRGTGRFSRWFYRTLLAPVGRALATVLDLLVVRPVVAIARGAWWLLRMAAIGVGKTIEWLVVLPLVLLWRYVLRPPLVGLGWAARWLGGLLARFGRGTGMVLAAFWHAFTGSLAWAWRVIGTGLRWLGRVLFVIPAVLVWRYALRPVALGVAAVWRVTVVTPSRWVKASVLLPAGRGMHSAWRVSVREPAAWVRAMVRGTSREVRLQVRRAFGRA
ncbi:hypothetical protein [Actinomadura hibisca]|uniref:hypothetical protein n=1 Tax=Actinomadura hibisca TaxID=68565 RepID=UPI0008313DBB|nr:hypothetical protein [Actinomadura hibisca]